MSYYRDTYLKSEDWKSLRAIKLVTQKCRCQLCGAVSKSNDVHHVKYKHLFDVQIADLKVLCRKCHDAVHALMEKYPAMKNLPRHKLWQTAKDHLLKDARIASQAKKTERKEKYIIARKQTVVQQTFSMFRNQLVISGKVYRRRMIWNDALAECVNIPSTAEEFLEFYMLKTECDPRILTPYPSMERAI